VRKVVLHSKWHRLLRCGPEDEHAEHLDEDLADSIVA
jgi:hypothetical protein